MIKAYKYTDAHQDVVHVIDEGGISRISMLASAVPDGVTIQPADPLPVVTRSTWTPLEFMERFSEEQQLAIATAAMQSAPVKLWYDKMLASQEVNIEDARTITGMRVLLAQGLIDQETHDRVMSAEQV